LLDLHEFDDLLQLFGWDILLLVLIMRGGFSLINTGYNIMRGVDEDV